MIRIVFIFNCLIFFSFIQANRCVEGFLNNRDRPQLDTFYLSESGHFKIYYDLSNEDGNLPPEEDIDQDEVPDYIESVAEIAEESRNVLINDMGYLSEPQDDEEGIYDIYIIDQSAWGYNWVDNSSIGSSYITIDNDYLGNNFNSDYCFNPIDKMKISVAHEFFHAIQRSYRLPAIDHDFFLEMSSMWFEDLIVPDCNDYLGWVGNLSYTIFRNPEQQFDGSDLISGQEDGFGYSMALFGHYLSRIVDKSGLMNEMDSSIMRLIWENYSNSIDEGGLNAAGVAIKTTIEDTYEAVFSQVWADFISSNMLCGEFNFFNEDIYYYYDQELINPIIIEPSNYLWPNSNDNTSIDLDNNSVNIFSSLAVVNMYLDIELSNIEDISGYYIVKGSNSSRGLIENSTLSDILINSGGLFSLILSPESQSSSVNVEINSESVPSTKITNFYPNPLASNQNLYIEIESSQNISNYSINIYNVLGQDLGTFNYENLQLGFNEKISVPINNIITSSGIYFIEIDVENNRLLSKVVFIQ